MNRLVKHPIKTAFVLCILLLTSCIATNNMYVNNPVSLEKGDADPYIAISTGLEARLDSTQVGDIYETDYKTVIAPVLSIGGQIGLGKQFDLRAAFHLPYLLGGAGLRIGSQYSFTNRNAPFNMAFGTDLGFTFSRDSLFNSEIKSDTRGIFNGDVFLPMSYSFSDDLSIILTPRYTFSWISMDDILYEDKANYFNSHYPLITLGFRAKGLYLETSALFTPKKVYPQVGIAFIFL